ncbi:MULTISPECIES: DeoR family transcriptional regulator [Amycolatopsis]|uniref:DeoR family transcriptional regulator n=1 Tax=Amycolatopsis TaxID=1813 RepID=UPI00351CDE79
MSTAPPPTRKRETGMTPRQRLNALLESASERGSVTIAEIGGAPGISPATARRDLPTLADQRLITRIRSGAVALDTGCEPPPQYRSPGRPRRRSPPARRRRASGSSAATTKPGWPRPTSPTSCPPARGSQAS